jgi:hypothetical protein
MIETVRRCRTVDAAAPKGAAAFLRSDRNLTETTEQIVKFLSASSPKTLDLQGFAIQSLPW